MAWVCFCSRNALPLVSFRNASSKAKQFAAQVARSVQWRRVKSKVYSAVQVVLHHSNKAAKISHVNFRGRDKERIYKSRWNGWLKSMCVTTCCTLTAHVVQHKTARAAVKFAARSILLKISWYAYAKFVMSPEHQHELHFAESERSVHEGCYFLLTCAAIFVFDSKYSRIYTSRWLWSCTFTWVGQWTWSHRKRVWFFVFDLCYIKLK